MPPAAAFQAQSSGFQPRACIPCVKHNEHAACGLSSPHKSAGRGRSALESRVSVWTRGYRPNAQGLMDIFGAYGRLIPVRDRCQREAAGARLVRVVKLASMRLRELRGGMRRIGGTCTAAQTRIRCKDVATQEYDRNGGGIRRRRRVPVGMASFAAQRPIARIAASGSAKLWLLTCDRRHHRAISAEYARFPPPRERQAPIIQLATKHRDPRQDRRQPGGETGQQGCDDIVTLGRAVCTHRMRLGGTRQRLGNGGCRQRVYDAGNRLTGGRKRRSTCISAGPSGRSAA